jgi:hypothetical protein
LRWLHTRHPRTEARNGRFRHPAIELARTAAEPSRVPRPRPRHHWPKFARPLVAHHADPWRQATEHRGIRGTHCPSIGILRLGLKSARWPPDRRTRTSDSFASSVATSSEASFGSTPSHQALSTSGRALAGDRETARTVGDPALSDAQHPRSSQRRQRRPCQLDQRVDVATLGAPTVQAVAPDQPPASRLFEPVGHDAAKGGARSRRDEVPGARPSEWRSCVGAHHGGSKHSGEPIASAPVPGAPVGRLDSLAIVGRAGIACPAS